MRISDAGKAAFEVLGYIPVVGLITAAGRQLYSIGKRIEHYKASGEPYALSQLKVMTCTITIAEQKWLSLSDAVPFMKLGIKIKQLILKEEGAHNLDINSWASTEEKIQKYWNRIQPGA